MGESGGLRTGWLAAFGTEGYDGEPPLLEELGRTIHENEHTTRTKTLMKYTGVNFGHIKTKTLAVLSPFSISEHLMDDSDLAGPILFFLLFGFFLLAGGKLHFGYIYGLALLGSCSLHAILSLMSPPLSPAEQAGQSQDARDQATGYGGGSRHFSSTLTLARSASTLGYCLLPLCLTSLVGILVPLDGLFGYILTSAAIAWATYSASAIFCSVGRMTSMRFLVAYPLALFYTGFGIMSIFSSRGTGGLEQRTKGG